MFSEIFFLCSWYDCILLSLLLLIFFLATNKYQDLDNIYGASYIIFFLSTPLLSTVLYQNLEICKVLKGYQYQPSIPRRWAMWFCLSMIIQEYENKHVKVERTWSVTYAFPHINTILCSHPSACTAVLQQNFLTDHYILLHCTKYYIYITFIFVRFVSPLFS